MCPIKWFSVVHSSFLPFFYDGFRSKFVMYFSLVKNAKESGTAIWWTTSCENSSNCSVENIFCDFVKLFDTIPANPSKSCLQECNDRKDLCKIQASINDEVILFNPHLQIRCKFKYAEGSEAKYTNFRFLAYAVKMK